MGVTKSELLNAVAIASSGYFAANPMKPEEIDGVIKTFFRVFSEASESGLLAVDHAPPVPTEQSVKDEAIVCLECAKEMRSLKNHLRIAHNLTPSAYRAKWGLPENYPMVSPATSQKRSEISQNTQSKIKERLGPKGRLGGRKKRAEISD